MAMSFDIYNVSAKFLEAGIESDELNNYLLALNDKMYRAVHFHELFLSQLTTYNQDPPEHRGIKKTELTLEDVKIAGKWFHENYAKMDSYASASIHNFHSIGDTLGQIINETVLTDPDKLPPGSYLYYVTNKLSNLGIALNVLNETKKLTDSYEWKYVTAFDNTEKHLRLIDSFDNRNYGEKEADPSFREFQRTYRGVTEVYSSTSIKEVLKNSETTIISGVDNVLKEIYSFLGV